MASYDPWLTTISRSSRIVEAAGGELVPRQEIDPRTLVQALRYLQERIPDAVHLTLREKQSLARTANFDPAVIERPAPGRVVEHDEGGAGPVDGGGPGGAGDGAAVG